MSLSITKRVQKPELVEYNGKSFSLSGWHHHPVEEHLKWHLTQTPDKQWCEISCLARTAFLRNTPDNQHKVRVRLTKLVRVLIEKKRLLVVDYSAKKGEHRKATRCKLFSASSSEEHAHVIAQLDKMQKRMKLSEQMYTDALDIVTGQV